MATRKKVNRGLKRGTKKGKLLRGGATLLPAEIAAPLEKYIINTYFAPFFYMGDNKDKDIDPVMLHKKLTSKLFKNKILNARYWDAIQAGGRSNGSEAVIAFICFLIYFNKYEFTGQDVKMTKEINNDTKVNIDDKGVTNPWDRIDEEFNQFISGNLPSKSSRVKNVWPSFKFYYDAQEAIDKSYHSLLRRYNLAAIKEIYVEKPEEGENIKEYV